MKLIAVLLTCHNRHEKTLICLKSLFESKLSKDFKLDVFLVDDESTDGTSEVVKQQFPKVNIIHGDGSLFWTGGMRLAWKTATETGDYDFYLWLNDDVILDNNALIELLECSLEAKLKDHFPAIITGSCHNSTDSEEFSYGGRTKQGPVVPNGKIQLCRYINGNVVLIPSEIFKKIGNLSPDYTHAMGDFDYGLRAIKAGFKCYVSKSYIATCQLNERMPDWYNPSIKLKKRWQSLYSPSGLNFKEYLLFRKKFWGFKWVIFAAKAYLKTLFPKLYGKFSN
jgi:GT2 family glycosyltransferase